MRLCGGVEPPVAARPSRLLHESDAFVIPDGLDVDVRVASQPSDGEAFFSHALAPVVTTGCMLPMRKQIDSATLVETKDEGRGTREGATYYLTTRTSASVIEGKLPLTAAEALAYLKRAHGLAIEVRDAQQRAVSLEMLHKEASPAR